jgi:hypothetical protein
MNNRWTQERKTQQAKIIQRWKPWERATGPKTADGKTKVARNAFKGEKRPLLRRSMAMLKRYFKGNQDFLDKV